ncbi:DNA-binding protein D-ETS-4 [Toxorhynchites rutilus septentrionalis]|uniref:DNA-binding protein D-ETS-4 n=1 Tax=Toxorhynchites rutilus septentrionalis TaxID=329112 RepID=UPI002479A4E9|nr:DNA-binding protein D-ETS-4 [Toxorhynchites rutilus septentrionalis]
MTQEVMFYPKETTPQTVPAGDYTSDFFASYAELFDLSLLTPSDSQVPLSPQSEQQRQQQQQQLQSGLPTASASEVLDYIPATIFHDVPELVQQQTLHQMKQEKPTSWNENIGESSLKSVLLEQLQSGPQYQYYPSALLSPPQEQYAVFPPSPTPSIPDFQSLGGNFVTIKQEYCSLPPSPPDSNGAPSPVHCSEIKTEFDAEPSIDIDSLLGSSRQLEEDSPSKLEFQILREHLQDTSFQRKHNLKPVELESLIGGLTTRADIGSVFELALQDAQDGIQATCNELGISADPRQWTTSQVQQWLQLTMNKYGLTPLANIAALFPESGDQLALLSMDEFVRRIPQGGDKLHGHLELWKQIYRSTIAVVGTTPSSSGTSEVASPATQDSTGSFETESLNGDISDDEDEEMPLDTSSISAQASTSGSVVTAAATTATSPSGTTKPRQGGSHIHLWQFLKELLATPDQHQGAIRWIDRSKGVFKIEDSVRVARLWGRRKNRPAMNYDKLSRSIRQYYKKGIMQKTERSQRLVYQFCHPYSL